MLQIQIQKNLPVQTAPPVTERAMADAMTALLRLPDTPHSPINIEAANQAYFDYLTAKPEAKAAAYQEAVKLLGESAEAALEDPSLDAGTREALEGLLGEIDSGRGIGDNGNNGTKLRDGLLSDGYVILETKSAEASNTEWANRGYDKPPIKPETEVFIVEAGDNQYVRFYNVDENGKGNMIGRWLVKLSDIEGLTLSEIVDKYALPEPPEYICDVNLPENFFFEVSEANGLDGWGEGGGVQYDTMDGNLEVDWFTNSRKFD
jgi:hypothetical protein